MGSVSLQNKGAEGVPFFTPEQNPPAGTALKPASAPTLFKPLRMRSVELNNRFGVSPMCQYSCADGHVTDYHLVHLGQYALFGAGLVFVEATAVEARGRISPEDSGLWKDSQIEPLRRIVDFIHSQGSKAAIQIAHAGRKASTLAPWIGGTIKKTAADESVNGWPDDVVAPSAIPFADTYHTPKELTVAEIKGLVKSFAETAQRAVKAGFDVIELHGAHGYLMSEFMSPISNRRTDEYGGSFENRTRFIREAIEATRAVIPTDMPLWLRISASEWMEWTNEPSWDIESSIQLAKLLPSLGVDVLDVSSGGNNNKQRIEPHNSYQIDLAGQIREAVRAEGSELLIAAVGAVSEAEMARSIVGGGKAGVDASDGTIEVDAENGQVVKADIVLAARQFLREPNWVLRVADELNVPVQWPNQYQRAPKRGESKF